MKMEGKFGGNYYFLSKSDDDSHEVKAIASSGKEADELLPHVHLVISLVKRRIYGTYQGKISPKYLEYYLDEFAFRFNKKMSTPTEESYFSD